MFRNHTFNILITGFVVTLHSCTTTNVNMTSNFSQSPVDESGVVANRTLKPDTAGKPEMTSSNAAKPLLAGSLKNSSQYPQSTNGESSCNCQKNPQNTTGGMAASSLPLQSENLSDPAHSSTNSTALATTGSNPENEKEFFNELSKQDPALKKNSDESSQEYVFTVPVPEDNHEKVVLKEESDFKQNKGEDLTGGTVPSTASDLGKMSGKGFDQVGTASWYGRDFNGKPTASGEIFDSQKLTAAHKDLPLGSIVLVRNMDNGKEVLVRINDRGPYVDGRILDMSEYGAHLLGYRTKGLASVGIKLVRRGDVAVKGPGVTASFYDDSEESSPYPAGSGDDEMTESDYVAAAIRGTNSESSSGKEDYIDYTKDIVPLKELKGFSVQVGVFEDIKNAVGLKKYLNTYGVPVSIVNKGSVYAVLAGQFNTRYAAEQLKYQMVSDGYNVFIADNSK